MSQQRVTVLHWIMAKTVRKYGSSAPESDLLGVTLDYFVPPDTEFPTERRNVALYLQLTARDAGTTEFLVQVHHEPRPDEWSLVSQTGDAGRPINLPEDRWVDWVEVIRIPFIPLPAPGLYAVTIYFRPPDDVEAEYLSEMPWDPSEPGWEFGAVEYFWVRKP